MAFKTRQFAQQRFGSQENPANEAPLSLDDHQKDEHGLPFQTFFAHERVNEKPARPAREVIRSPFVVVVGDLNLPQCKKYRVMQKMESLSRLGIANDYSHCDDLRRAMNQIQLATFVIFYRARANDVFKVLVAECRRLGVPFAYDIDDPIFSEAIYGENPNLQFLTMVERKNLLASTRIHLDALLECERAIVSTPRLAAEIRELTPVDVHLWRNAIDKETLEAARLATKSKKKQTDTQSVKIVYASGSRAHEADFREIEGVLSDLLEDQQQVCLQIIGYLELPKSFADFGDRVTVVPFSDYIGYMEALSGADIALVPLVQDSFNDCKSAIRYMEAALVKTPCIVSNIGDFTSIIENGKNGYLASNAAEWSSALNQLISDPKLRKSMADNARKTVMSRLTVPQVTESLDQDLLDLLQVKHD